MKTWNGIESMKTWNLVKIGGVALAAVVLGTAGADAIIAFDTPNTTVGNQASGGPYNLGEQFTVNSPVTITSLGAYDSGQNGWGAATITVAIYQIVGGVGGGNDPIVGSTAAFNTSNPGSIASGSSYAFQSVTPFNLAAGSYMIVANGLGTSANPSFNAGFNGNVTTVAVNTGGGLLSYPGSGNFWSAGAGGLSLPTTLDAVPIARYAAGSFEFTPVPEVATFGVAAVGLLGLVYLVRHTRNRRTLKMV